MNTQNILVLAGQLQALGFVDMGYPLAKRICFGPDSFSLTHRIEREDSSLSFQLHFEKSNTQDEYILVCYDALFQKTTSFEESINGINIAALNEQMATIDWQKAFDFTEKKPLANGDKASLEKELKIEAIMDNLLLLQTTNTGKAVAASLKLKYWSGTSYQEVYGNISGPKNKAEVSQRFYFLEGQSGISVEEAYRYLQNRWLEKEMLAKKKLADRQDNISGEDSREAGGSLVRKKRSKKMKLAKTEK